MVNILNVQKLYNIFCIFNILTIEYFYTFRILTVVYLCIYVIVYPLYVLTILIYLMAARLRLYFLFLIYSRY